MRQAYLLLAILIFLAPEASALFHQHKTTPESSVRSSQPAQQQAQIFEYTASSYPAIQEAQHFYPKRHVNPDDSYRSTLEGTISVVCAAFSLLFFVAVSAASFPLFLIPAFVFAVAATVFGAIGIKRHRRGFAILGLALGLLEIIGGFFIASQL
jgi:hypothetical protein